MNLRIDWCSHKAAKYACENWHYSGCMPSGKLVKLGVWEDGVFVGVVIFGRGATPNLPKPYGLLQTECVELTRIALTAHQSPVSRIMMVAMKLLKKQSPGLRLVVSFADPGEGHHGGVYQATNWVYCGKSPNATFFIINGKKTHPRSLGAKGVQQNITGAKRLDIKAKPLECIGKHRYLMPLDAEMREQIKHLSKPYPKQMRPNGAKSADHVDSGGSTPTRTLQISGGG